MPSISSQTMKLKSTLRLLIPRLRMAQKKDTSLSISSRREMATLLSQHREASARIRVENIIQTDITVEVMEMLELYAELLLARAGLLDTVKENDDTGLEEASAAIIYAAPRLPREVKELGIVRSMLIERWGKDFGAAAAENRDGVVPEKIVKKLKVETPSTQLVSLYLEEIAKAYGVDWPRQTSEDEQVKDLKDEVDREERDDDEDGGGDGGGAKEAPIPATPGKSKAENLGKAYSPEDLNRATPPREVGTARSPISVAPPGPRTDNVRPKVKIPGGDEVKKNAGEERKPATTAAAAAGKNVVGGKIPDVDELAKRFRELKR